MECMSCRISKCRTEGTTECIEAPIVKPVVGLWVLPARKGETLVFLPEEVEGDWDNLRQGLPLLMSLKGTS